MTGRYVLRQAGREELRAVSALLAEGGTWMNARGYYAWKPSGFPDSRLAPGLAEGAVWLLRDGDRPVATVTVDRHPDPEFAALKIDTSGAVIVHRMAVTRDPAYAGKGIGELLLAWITDRAARTGQEVVMLNCNRFAEPLQRWYLRNGFTHIATAELPGRQSGWLARREARWIPGLSGFVADQASSSSL